MATQMKPGLRAYVFLLVPVSIGIMLPSIFISWMAVNFLGFHQFSPIEIISELYGAKEPQSGFDIRNLLLSYNDTFTYAVASLSLYFASLIGMIISAGWGKHRSRIALAAGIIAITAATLWIYSVESLKENFARQAGITGGIIGEEFKGHESTLADILIQLGIGQYFVAAGGIVAIFNYFVEKKLVRSRVPAV
jgi:hypothetical protein